MQSVETIAAPPNHGRICLARSGCTRKSRKALRKIVAACSSIGNSRAGIGSAEVRGLYSRMLAQSLRILLLIELAAYAALAFWLNLLLGWSYTALAGLAVGIALALRLAIVCAGEAIGSAAASPRPPEQRIGAAAALAMVLRECRAVTSANLF